MNKWAWAFLACCMAVVVAVVLYAIYFLSHIAI